MLGVSRGTAAKKLFKIEDLRRLRQILSVRRDDEVTELDPKDRPVWNPAMRMFSTRIVSSTRIYGLDVPSNSEVFYSESGRLSSISLGDALRLHDCHLNPRSIVYFYKEGSVDWISLPTDSMVRSLNKKGPKLRARQLASFYRNGFLKETTLAEDTSLQGHRFSEESVVHFANTGPLVWVQLKQASSFPLDKQRMVAQDHSCVEFHHNGQIRSLVLADDVSIQGHFFNKGVNVHFDIHGKLSLAKIYQVARGGFETHPSSGMAVRFQRDGAIREITVT